MVLTSKRPLEVLAWPARKKRELNPYGALLYDHVEALGVRIHEWTPVRALLKRFDIWHLHFPDAVLAPQSPVKSLLGVVAFRILLLVARLRGTRILWSVHDVGSLDQLHPRLESWFWSYFSPRVDATIYLSETARLLTEHRFPELQGRRFCKIPHGQYRDAYPDEISATEARRHLGLPEAATVILYFGRIRFYKDVPHLIRTFCALDRVDLWLLIVGQPFSAQIEEEVRSAARGNDRVRLALEVVPAKQVQIFFKAADLVVLPYRRILHSGTAMLALGFNRPVLVPDLGSMREHQTLLGSSWIRLYTGTLNPELLTDAIDWATHASRPSRCDLSAFDWKSIAAQTRAVYDDLAGPGPRFTRTLRSWGAG